MSLDKLLETNKAWLEETLKRRIFDKVDEKTIKFPEEQRERRREELRARISELSRRKEEVAASYDRAIALEKAELEALEAQRSASAPSAPPNMADRNRRE